MHHQLLNHFSRVFRSQLDHLTRTRFELLFIVKVVIATDGEARKDTAYVRL